MIICRGMTIADAPSVFAMLSDNLDGAFSLDVIEYFIMMWPEGQFVAEDVTGRIVGALCGNRMSETRASIPLFAVSQKYRNQGIGTRLYESFRTRCHMSGFTEIQLELRTTNKDAFRLYTRWGFSVFEEVPSLYGPGQNGFRMLVRIGRVSS